MWNHWNRIDYPSVCQCLLWSTRCREESGASGDSSWASICLPCCRGSPQPIEGLWHNGFVVTTHKTVTVCKDHSDKSTIPHIYSNPGTRYLILDTSIHQFPSRDTHPRADLPLSTISAHAHPPSHLISSFHPVLQLRRQIPSRMACRLDRLYSWISSIYTAHTITNSMINYHQSTILP